MEPREGLAAEAPEPSGPEEPVQGSPGLAGTEEAEVQVRGLPTGLGGTPALGWLFLCCLQALWASWDRPRGSRHPHLQTVAPAAPEGGEAGDRGMEQHVPRLTSSRDREFRIRARQAGEEPRRPREGQRPLGPWGGRRGDEGTVVQP